MGCYLIKGVCPCEPLGKDDEILKSIEHKSEISSEDDSSHNIWENNSSLQKEFKNSISKALRSSESDCSESMLKSKESLTVKTMKVEILLENSTFRKSFIKSKTIGN